MSARRSNTRGQSSNQSTPSMSKLRSSPPPTMEEDDGAATPRASHQQLRQSAHGASSPLFFRSSSPGGGLDTSSPAPSRATDLRGRMPYDREFSKFLYSLRSSGREFLKRIPLGLEQGLIMSVWWCSFITIDVCIEFAHGRDGTE